MSVKNIENVKIPGFGNYYLYSFQYNPGFSDSPGSVDAEFLNESGVYIEPDLNQHIFFQIRITMGDGVQRSLGNFTTASWEILNTNQYKVLKVRFLDKSCELDRYYIALRGQIGYDNTALSQMSQKERALIIGVTTSPGRLIFVGDSDEHCKQSVLDSIDGQDPCDPCDPAPDGSIVNKIDCQEYYLINKRAYTYTLSDLVAAVNSSSAGIRISSSEYSDYQFEYTGTIREVLNNICSDLGLTFFYDPTLNIVKIVDVRNGISINLKNIYDTDKKHKIIEDSKKRSREGSKSVFGVTSFRREAEEKEYNCELNACKKLKLHPLVLEDLMTDAAHFEDDEIISENLFERLEFYSVLTGRVGRVFRDMFLWYQEYEFNTASDVHAKINIKLNALNGMTIKRVFSSASPNAEDQRIYRVLNRIYTAKNFDNIKDKIAKKKAYYFLAEIDEQHDEKIHNLENALANSFFGRYWMRKYKQHWTGLSYTTISPDGSVEYYDFENPINLPFSDIIVDAGGKLEESAIFERVEDDSFYFMTRPAVYSPQTLEEDMRENIEENISKYYFTEVSIPINLANKFKSMTGLDKYDQKRYKLFVVPEEMGTNAASVSLQISEDEDHPEEKPNVIIPINACEKSTSYGLESANTKKFDIAFKDIRFSLMMPVQSYSDGDHAGYIVLVERSGDNKSVFIPKTEIFLNSNVPTATTPTMGIELNSYDATSNDLNLLSKASGGQVCNLDVAKVNDLLSSISSLLGYNIGNSEERSFKIEGLPYDYYGVMDGLRSFSIGLGNSGLTTSIQFSNTFPFRLSPDVFLKKLRTTRLNQIQESFPAGKHIVDENAGLPEV